MLLYLKIKPNQRLNRLEYHEDGYVVRIAAPAIDGKANRELISFLSEILALPKSKIVLKKGQTGRLKCIEVDAGPDHIESRCKLAAASAQ